MRLQLRASMLHGNFNRRWELTGERTGRRSYRPQQSDVVGETVNGSSMV